MRIGIDIDGVLTDLERFMIDYNTKYCFDNNIPVGINLGEYDDKMFNCDDENVVNFWRQYIIDYFQNYPSRYFAAEIIRKLKEEGHEIYIVTSRNGYGVPPEYLDEVQNLTKTWLEKQGVVYDKIISTEGSKLPYCRGNYIELMIEDSPNNIKEISNNIPVFCFTSFWNQNVEGKNITRVNSWYEIYDKIKKIG